MKQTLLLTLALIGGFVGGIVGSHLDRMHKDAQTPLTVRAHRFELLDRSGRAVAFWGIDQTDYPVLAFVESPAEPRTGNRQSPLKIDDPVNQQIALGLMGGGPFLDLRGTDGKTRIRLNLAVYQKPVMWMADETRPRVWLGYRQSDAPTPDEDDWFLSFGDSAWIGMKNEKQGVRKYFRGFLGVDKNRTPN